MAAPLNTFKAGLKSGKVQIGCWAGMADAYATEVLGTAGFDWVLVDGEHAPNDLRSILSQLHALQGSQSAVVVRLPKADETLVKQALDLGVQSLMLPMIETLEQARAMVRAVRYPPAGRRGVGAGMARATQFALVPDYQRTADAQIALLLQVESRAGLAALDEILSLEGVDGVFIGPSDLAADMGYGDQSAHPEVRKTIIAALKKIKASGKAAGILSTEESFTRTCIEMGVEFTAVGVDIVVFAKALRALSAQFKQQK